MIGVKLEIGRGFGKELATRGLDVAAVEELIPVSAAAALGEAIRKRVQERGDLAGQPVHGYNEQFKPFLVSAKYPDRATGDKHWSGAERFRNSDEYHRQAGVKLGTFSVTGGMWSGLSRVVHSVKRTDLMFRGRSDGQRARVINGKSRPIKESNALKAWTVNVQSGVNLLALHDRELHALGEGCMLAMAAGVGNMLPIIWSGTAPPKDIAGIFRRALGVQRDLPAGAPGGA